MAAESSVPSSHPRHVSQQTRRDKLRFVFPPTNSGGGGVASPSPSPSPLFANPSPVARDASPICRNLLPRSKPPARRDRVEIREVARSGPGEPWSSVPLGPFVGYASVLKRSSFLRAAEQVLEEFCGVDRRGKGIQDRTCLSSYLMDLSLENLRKSSPEVSPAVFNRGNEHSLKNLRLIFLLDEVYKRYKLYFQQIQSVVVSFEAVSGLENAAPYVVFAFKAVWKHFKCLKDAILDQIRIMDKRSTDNGVVQDSSTLGLWTADQGFHGDKSVQNPTFSQHTVCRSRSNGLPDYAVVVLRSWLFEHFLHPYPTDLDKQTLAQQTGLSKTQVTNWFINARVRLWKPMVVEELQARTLYESDSQNDQNANNLQSDQHIPFADLPPQEKQFPATLAQRTPGVQTKRRREEYTHVPNEIGDQMKSSCSDLLSSHDSVIWNSAVQSSVSLALGLNQNNGLQMSSPSHRTTGTRRL